MDALSDVLRLARLSGGVFLHAQFHAPWCVVGRFAPEMCAPFMEDPVRHVIPYHYVVEGELVVALPGEAPLTVRAGEIILFPRNDAHHMGSDVAHPPVKIGELLAPSAEAGLLAIHYGRDGAVTRLVCGYLACDVMRGNPVFETLPASMRVRIEEAGPAEWIRTTFQYAAGEIAAGRAGSATVLAKLSELLFVEAVRRYAMTLPPGHSGWFAGLQDPVVARVLALMHGAVSRDWNVEELGRAAGLSRSALAERFTRVIGLPPMQYLAQWRMHVAAQALRGSAVPLARLAAQVGYESEAAFSRAFRKAFGSAPATWRRSAG
jgi:AraC-like DNA-binding protein